MQKRILLQYVIVIFIIFLITGTCLVSAGGPPIVSGPILNIPNPTTPVQMNPVVSPPAVAIPSTSSVVTADPGGCGCCNEAIGTDGSRDVRDLEAVSFEVDVISREIKEKGWDWVAGPTSVMFKSDKYRQNLRGLNHDSPPQFSIATLSEPSAEAVRALPVSFDWRNKDGNWLTPVRDQGNCGSCWAFATTGAFESYWERRVNNPDLNPNFAEQALVSCANDQSGCDGGLFTAMAYFVNKQLSGAVGTVLESAYPYTARDSACISLTGQNRYKIHNGGSWGYVGGGTEWTIPSVDAIKDAVYNYGPVAAGVYADSKFDSYSSGIFSSRVTSNNYYSNHAVLIVGWGVYNGRNYWIVKNSWGTNWGENGYFKIYTDQNRIGEGAVYFTAPTSSPVNPGPVISSVSPLYGSNTQNTKIAITGKNFRAGAKVFMISGSVSKLATISSLSSTKIVCVLPTKGQTAVYWDIRVRNADGTVTTKKAAISISGGSYPAPVITSVSPWYGFDDQNTRVTITGYNFRPGAKVFMISGSISKLATISSLSSTKIVCTLPTKGQKIGWWNIRVRNPDGKTGTLWYAFYLDWW